VLLGLFLGFAGCLDRGRSPFSPPPLKFRGLEAAMFRVLWIAAFAVPLANAAAASSSEHSQIQSVAHEDRHHHHRFMSAAKDAVKSADPEEEDDAEDTEEVEKPEVSKVDKMKQKLEELNTLEVKLEDRLEYLENEHYEQKIAMEQKPVANETVPALAKMLGSMRKEMHEFVTPFYNEELEDRLEDIEEEQSQLKDDISAEEGGKKKEKKEVKEEPKEEVKEEPKEEPEATTAAPKKAKDDLWHNGTKVLIAGMVGIVLFIVISFIVKRRQA